MNISKTKVSVKRFCFYGKSFAHVLIVDCYKVGIRQTMVHTQCQVLEQFTTAYVYEILSKY